MTLLFIGDIVARPGRDLVRRGLQALVRAHGIDMVLANVENAAGGAGVTRDVVDEALGAGIHVLTSGNHIWDKREVLAFIDDEPRLLRPVNFPRGAPGAGSFVYESAGRASVGVINVLGRVFLANIDDPFAAVTREIDRLRNLGARLIVVDFHAEATSEKLAMGWHLDGLVTAVIGTHTHVQTADERVLPAGTAYISDVGMTGAHDGVIGMEKTGVISRFLTGMPIRMEAATGDLRLNAVIVAADPDTGLATGIRRLSLSVDELETLRSQAARREPMTTLP